MSDEVKKFVQVTKEKIARREAVVIDATKWGFLHSQDFGLEEKAQLAGPGASIYKGPGGYWKMVINGDNIEIAPITEEEAHEFRRSLS